MQTAARAVGIDLSDQRARQVVAADFTRFDRVLAMDSAVLAELHAMPGGDMAELFGDATGQRGDVPDPYYTGDFDGVMALIRDGVGRLVA